jgi:DNA-binding transcriptional regulator YiaG
MTTPAPLSPAELKTLRRALALSQAALAKRLGVQPGAVVRWETGVRSPPPYLRLALERLQDQQEQETPK